MNLADSGCNFLLRAAADKEVVQSGEERLVEACGKVLRREHGVANYDGAKGRARGDGEGHDASEGVTEEGWQGWHRTLHKLADIVGKLRKPVTVRHASG